MFPPPHNDIITFDKASGRYLPPDEAQKELRQEFETKYGELFGEEWSRME